MSITTQLRHHLHHIHKPTRAKIMKALQFYYDNTTIAIEIWEELYPHADPEITIPHYLHYVEEWDYTDFHNEFNISKPTFFNWLTKIQYRPTLKTDMKSAMRWVDRPVDTELYKQACRNERQFRSAGKSRNYPPSKNLARKLNQHMKTNKTLNAEDFVTTNKWRTMQQIHQYALSHDLECLEFGHYQKRKVRFKATPMSKIKGN